MTTLIIAFVLMLIIVAGMAVGVLMGREPISGSCGGMKKLGLDTECEVCGGRPELCESASASDAAVDSELFQNADRTGTGKKGRHSF